MANDEYWNQLMKNYGRTPDYYYRGPKCTKDCKHLKHYETYHSHDCPFYKDSMSEELDLLKVKIT